MMLGDRQGIGIAPICQAICYVQRLLIFRVLQDATPWFALIRPKGFRLPAQPWPDAACV